MAARYDYIFTIPIATDMREQIRSAATHLGYRSSAEYARDCLRAGMEIVGHYKEPPFTKKED